jgi:hypothetical protein
MALPITGNCDTSHIFCVKTRPRAGLGNEQNMTAATKSQETPETFNNGRWFLATNIWKGKFKLFSAVALLA